MHWITELAYQTAGGARVNWSGEGRKTSGRTGACAGLVADFLDPVRDESSALCQLRCERWGCWKDGHQFKLFWIKPACLPSICKRWDGWLQLFFFSNTCLRSGRVTIWVRNALSSRLCHSFAAWPSGVSHCSAIPPILSLVEDFDSPQLSEFMKSILEAYPIFDLDVRHVCSSLIALCRRHCLFSLAMCCLNEGVGFSGKRVMYAWCKSFWVTIIARG